MTRNLSNFYVYGYFEPDNYEPFYIGKGHDRRCFEHLESNLLNQKNPFHLKLKSLLDSRVKPEIHIYEEDLTEDQALILEIALIKKFGRRDLETGCLLNLTDGGEGSTGYKHTDESKDKISISNLNRWKNLDYKEKQKIENLSGGWDLNRFKRKKVGRFYCGKLNKIYEAISHVKKDGFYPSAVRLVLNKEIKQHGGYDWRLLDGTL